MISLRAVKHKNVRKGGVSLRTFSLLKGMQVFNQNGKHQGEVCDMCIGKEGVVTDLLLHVRGFIGKKYRIPIHIVTSFGEDSIIIKNNEDLLKYEEVDEEYTLFHNKPLSKKVALSERGDELGLLDDVYFLEEVGTIVGYELTDGFFSDVTQGKRIIRTPKPPTFGEDAIIVSVNKRGAKNQ